MLSLLGHFHGEKTPFSRSEKNLMPRFLYAATPIGRFCWELLMPVLLDKSSGVAALLLVKMDL